MSIDEMPAGRELDALIAERVMGYTLNYEFAVPGIRMPTVDALRDKYDEWGEIPEYSTDMGDAWLAVAILLIPMQLFLNADGTRRCVFFPKQGGYVESEADTAPLAICRAALKAVGMA